MEYLAGRTKAKVSSDRLAFVVFITDLNTVARQRDIVQGKGGNQLALAFRRAQ